VQVVDWKLFANGVGKLKLEVMTFDGGLSELGVPLRFILLFPSQNLVDFGEYKHGSSTIELGQHGRIPST
jgi:hypothetical protein